MPGVCWKYKILSLCIRKGPKGPAQAVWRAQFGVEAGFCQEMEKVRLRSAGRAAPGHRWDSPELGCAG